MHFSSPRLRVAASSAFLALNCGKCQNKILNNYRT